MKKIFSFLLTSALLLAVSASVVSCSNDDDEPENNPPKEEYVAKESEFSDALKKFKVSGFEYHQYQYVSKFSLHSEARSGVDATDRWKIGMYIENDPGVNKWNGTYQLHQLWGTLYGFEKGYEVVKAYLGTDEGVIPVKGAWIKFTDLHKTDKYGNKAYTIELHIDEMKEKNGDYARDINITFTGSLSGGMLEY